MWPGQALASGAETALWAADSDLGCVVGLVSRDAALAPCGHLRSEFLPESGREVLFTQMPSYAIEACQGTTGIFLK